MTMGNRQWHSAEELIALLEASGLERTRRGAYAVLRLPPFLDSPYSRDVFAVSVPLWEPSDDPAFTRIEYLAELKAANERAAWLLANYTAITRPTASRNPVKSLYRRMRR